MAKILFVDDDQVTLELMGQAAKLLGHRAILAKSGKDALNETKNQQPAMVFLDMMMPDLDGLQVLRTLKNDPETTNTPVIILSAGSSEDDSITCKLAGADGYLSKPIPLQILMETINRYSPQV